MTAPNCALCGGDTEISDVPAEREAMIREKNPLVDDEALRKVECQGCGHISFMRENTLQ